MVDPGGDLLLVGGGKMGGALLRGWLADGLSPASAHIIEPNPEARATFEGLGLASLVGDASELPRLSLSTMLLAVKPQVMAPVVDIVRPLVEGSSTLVISIAAGTPLAAFEKAFGAECPIIRVMPNTPAAVGKGMSVLCANAAATKTQRERAEGLMTAVGDTAWVEDEQLMHAVTALSGGGPAYVFHLVEAMAAAGVAAGLSEELAMRLARRTVEGAGALMEGDPADAATLRRNVTSPGGTTQAALRELMAGETKGETLSTLVTRAIDAAARRSRELAEAAG